MPRAIVIVLDGVGAGEAPDAAEFGDADHPHTIDHIRQVVGTIDAPLLSSMGFLGSDLVPEREVDASVEAVYGRLQPLSKGGKDSVTGHWEMMGVVYDRPFPTFPNGFPSDLVGEFEARIGSKVLGNKPASGTAIISELGPEHMNSGKPIVYTSADSVFQIACHEGVVPIDRLYEMSRVARELCVGENGVQRVIARPFEGEPGAFVRTDRRKDFPLPPPDNLIDRLSKPVFGIGVVPELFDGRGFRQVKRTQNNAEHWVMLDEALNSDADFIFANFEDFDMRFGHRNDPAGFAQCLADFDRELARRLPKLRDDDQLILTADHGNDPTTPSTDHSREYVPFVAIRRSVAGGRGSVATDLGDLAGFAHVGRAVEHHLDVGSGWDPFDSSK